MNNIRFYIHSTHCKTKDNDSSKDAVVVKEKILVKNDDGTEKWVDHLNIIRDPVRPFWITKPQFRDHHYKKEFEHISRLDQYICHDSELQYKLAQALGLPAWQKYKSIRELCTSPYVYGADISTETLIRQKYSDRLPKGYVPKLTKGAFDIENEVRGEGRINVLTFIHEHTIYTAALKEYCRIYDKANDKFTPATTEDCLKVIHEVIGSELVKHKFDLVFTIHESELDLIRWIFEKIHECKTDFIGIWNMGYDIPKILDRIEKLGGDPVDIMVPKEIPPEYRYVYWKEDGAKRDHFTDKWHWMSITGYSQFIDSMCLYARLRKVYGRDSSYSLDYISNKELGQGKLHFGEITNHWHAQTYEFLTYIAYNINDVLIMMLMEWKNNDIDAIYGLCGYSLMAQFASQTTQVQNESYHYGKTQKDDPRLPASIGRAMYNEWDSQFMKAGGTVLPPDKAVGVGVKALKGVNHTTQVSVATNDLDVSSMYPSTISAFNISKETQLAASLSINGFKPEALELYFSAITRPDLNAAEICSIFYGLPNYEQLEEEFEKEFGK